MTSSTKSKDGVAASPLAANTTQSTAVSPSAVGSDNPNSPRNIAARCWEDFEGILNGIN